MNTFLIIGIIIMSLLILYSFKDTYKEYFPFMFNTDTSNDNRNNSCRNGVCELPQKNRKLSQNKKHIENQDVDKKNDKCDTKENDSTSSSKNSSGTYQTTSQISASNTESSSSKHSSSNNSNMSSYQSSNGSFLSGDNKSSVNFDKNSNYSGSSFLSDQMD